MELYFRSRRRRLLVLSACLIGLVSVNGCWDGRPRRVQVSGKVLLNGEPLKLGIIQLVPTGGRPSGGMIMPDGSFTLGCYEVNDGCLLGPHRVLVNASERVTDSVLRWYAPPSYAGVNENSQVVDIQGPVDDLIINLQTPDGKPFKPFERRRQ